MPRPIGTAHPASAALRAGQFRSARHDRLDRRASRSATAARRCNFPTVNRKDKHDSLLARQRAPMPPLPPLLRSRRRRRRRSTLALADKDERPLRSVLATNFRADRAAGDADDAVADAATAQSRQGCVARLLRRRSARAGRSDRALGAGRGAGRAAPRRSRHQAVGAVAAVSRRREAGESIAAKGVVTGDDARPKSPAERLKLAGAARAKAEKCLANAVYFEARDEPVRAQIAVAQVVMNRVFSPFYPKTVCGVVYQNAGRHLACQFTFACDGMPGHRHRAGRLGARQAHRPRHARRQIVDAGGGEVDALSRLLGASELGRRDEADVPARRPIFYRPRDWGDGADEPHWGDAKTTARRSADPAEDVAGRAVGAPMPCARRVMRPRHGSDHEYSFW